MPISNSRNIMQNTWNQEKIKLIDNIFVVSYIDYLNKFVAIFNKDEKTDEGIYSGNAPDLEVGNLYYFKNTQKNIFPFYMYNRWIVARLFRCFPSKSSDLGDTWIPLSGEKSEYTSNYWFWIYDVYDSEKELLKKTRLNGFKNIINDNRYFDRIPRINETTHWDNGIISNTKVDVGYELAENSDNWDEFKLYHRTDIDKTFSIMKMLKPEHENPDR